MRLVGSSAGASASNGSCLVGLLLRGAWCVARRWRWAGSVDGLLRRRCRVRVWVDGAHRRAGPALGRFGRRFGLLLPAGCVFVVRLGSAGAGAGCSGW